MPLPLEALFYRGAGLMAAEFPVVCGWREARGAQAGMPFGAQGKHCATRKQPRRWREGLDCDGGAALRVWDPGMRDVAGLRRSERTYA